MTNAVLPLQDAKNQDSYQVPNLVNKKVVYEESNSRETRSRAFNQTDPNIDRQIGINALGFTIIVSLIASHSRKTSC